MAASIGSVSLRPFQDRGLGMSHPRCFLPSREGFPLARWGRGAHPQHLHHCNLLVSLSRLCFRQVLLSHRGSGRDPRAPRQPDHACEYQQGSFPLPTPLPTTLAQGSSVQTCHSFSHSSCGWGGGVRIHALTFAIQPVLGWGLCLCPGKGWNSREPGTRM